MFKKVLLIAAFAVASVSAYSYTCFPPLTVEGKFAVNPVIFADDKNSGGMETFFYYGLMKNMDISTSILTVNGSSGFSTMLRYGVGSSVLGVKLNPSLVIPQISYDWEDDRFILQSTVASQIVYDYSDKPAFYATISPGLKLSESTNINLDLSPGYYLQDGDFANYAGRTEGFGFDIAPCIGFAVGNCIFSVSVPIYNVQKDPTITFGAWLYYEVK